MVRRLRKASSGRDVPTYAENLLCVRGDSGEAEEAESLLVAPGESPLRFAGSTCLSAGAKNYGEYDLEKKIGVRVPVPRLFRFFLLVLRDVRATGCIVPPTKQIITSDWNHGRLCFQDAIEGDTLFHITRHRSFTPRCSRINKVRCRSSSRKLIIGFRI